MRNVLQADYEQVFLLPPCLEDWVGGEHPARFLREIVEQCDLQELGVEVPNLEEGGTCYSPRLLLSVWLYGYYSKIRSSRALEKACSQDLGFIWLSGCHRPDHNTLWRFWDRNRLALRKFFRQTVALALRLELVGFAFAAVDGTKVLGACATRRTCDREHLQKLLARLDAQMGEHEEAIVQAQAQEEARSAPSAELPEALRQPARLREKVRAALAQLEQSGQRYCHLQEPEAVRVPLQEGGNRFGYNAQAVVDAKAQIITAEGVLAQSNDLGLLVAMAEAAQANTGQPTAQVAADSGYCTLAQIGAAQASGLELLLPLVAGMAPAGDEPYHCSRFSHEASRDVVICPQGRELTFRRERERKGDGQRVREYRSWQACRDCPVRSACTKAKRGRVIELSGHEAAVQRLRERMQTETAQSDYKQRAATVEPVFARLKQHGGFRRFTLRGLQGVQVQWSMLCSALNLRRIYTFWRQAREQARLAACIATASAVSVALETLIAALAGRAEASRPSSARKRGGSRQWAFQSPLVLSAIINPAQMARTL